MKAHLEILLQIAETDLMSLKTWNFSGQRQDEIDALELKIALMEVHLNSLKT